MLSDFIGFIDHVFSRERKVIKSVLLKIFSEFTVIYKVMQFSCQRILKSNFSILIVSLSTA